MKKLFNLSIYNLDWFDNDWQQVESFCAENGFDGVELLASGLQELDSIADIPRDLIVSLHLAYYLDWLPLNKDLISNVDSQEVLATYQRQLNLAQELEVNYVVFHASSITPEEIFTQKFNYNDAEVLESVAEIINQAVKGLDLNFRLLFENLWWSGLTFLNQQQTIDFLEQLDFDLVGLLLDTGHLMNTNLRLNSEEEALKYLESIIEGLPQLWDWIYGVHLHKSLSGPYRYQNRAEIYQQFKDSELLEKKEELIIDFISNSDQHLPFTEVSLKGLMNLIEPEYLVHEFTSEQKEEFFDFLKLQDSLI